MFDPKVRAIATLWITVPCPPDKNIVGSKWVFCIKCAADSSIAKYKAHLVTRGFMQIQGIDYYDMYSPIARLASFWAILAYATCYNWKIESFNFNGAYLNSTLDDNKEIYMQELLGYKLEHTGVAVKRLKKSLYGLKQAGHKWYNALKCILIDLGFHISDTDPGVFHTHEDEYIIILAVHIDDCTLTRSSSKLIMQYKVKINKCYKFTDLGPIHWLLGIKITHDQDVCTTSLSQTTYIESIINCFNLTDTKSIVMLMIPGRIHTKQDVPSDAAEAAHIKNVPYREAIGSLMYASVAMHPDIMFTMSVLSQFLDNPREAHWDAVKHVFCYLMGTKTLTLTYSDE
jgi:hypothetical protein